MPAAIPRRRIARWFVWIGILLIIVGGSWALHDGIWYRTRTWRPVNQPISLTVGHIETPKFVVNVEENFAVDLAVDRSVPSDISVNVLGIGDLISQNNEDKPGFKLAWAVKSGNETVETGISDGRGEGYWGSATGRRLGFFHAQKNKPYTVQIDVIEEGSKLAPYHPRLLVHVDLFTLDGYAMGTGIMVLIGEGIGAIGLLFLIVGAVLHWRSR
jgi:hypothetical protein